MPKPEDKLFKEIKWGVTPGGHVAHILKDGEGIEIDENKDFNPRKVSHDEIFMNDADNITKQHFLHLADRAEYAYKEYRYIKGVSPILYGIRDYLTADSRQDQQDKLKEVRKQIQSFLKTIDNHTELASALKEFENTFANLTNGTLNTERIHSVNVNKNGKIDEPSTTRSTFIGSWRKTDDVLFPHEPSPNDIRQGLGVEDCFMLSGLTKIAASHPEKIKNAMRDNGDGTVTVRFYDFYGAEEANRGKAPEDHVAKQPVYITVNKTVRKAAGIANAYSSGSLWVQLFEKAYVTYRNTVESTHETGEAQRKLQKGYYAIDRSYPHSFLKAFLEDDYEGHTVIGCGKDISDDYGNSLLKLYDLDPSGKPVTAREPGYCKYENDLYHFLKPNLDKGEVITVGIATNSKVRESYVKSHGIRTGHAYTVLKCFEKEVDGQIKKFVQLRDPFAVYSAKYDDNGKLVNSSHEIKGTFTAGAENMGTFNLEISDFCMMFNSINGIKTSLAQEFEKMNKNYTLDDFVVQPPEMAKKREKGVEPILDFLEQKNGFETVRLSLKVLATNLAATDEWYISTNTPEFREMRNSLYAVQKQVEKIASEKRFPTMAERNKIAKACKVMQEKTQIYAEIKDAKKYDPKEKKFSNRAHCRLKTANHILNFCKGESTFKPIKNGFEENFGLTVKGITESLEKMNTEPNGANLVTNGGRNKAQVVAAAKQVEQIIQHDKSLIDGVNVTVQDLSNMKKQKEKAAFSDDFEMVESPSKTTEKAKDTPSISFGFEVM